MSSDYEHLSPDTRAIAELLADIRDELRALWELHSSEARRG